jgi:hypothetical protein
MFAGFVATRAVATAPAIRERPVQGKDWSPSFRMRESRFQDRIAGKTFLFGRTRLRSIAWLQSYRGFEIVGASAVFKNIAVSGSS